MPRPNSGETVLNYWQPTQYSMSLCHATHSNSSCTSVSTSYHPTRQSASADVFQWRGLPGLIGPHVRVVFQVSGGDIGVLSDAKPLTFGCCSLAVDGLTRTIGEAHRLFIRHVNLREGWRRNLWQRRFSSFILDQSYLLVCVCHVELNSVRAGLVDNPE